METSLTSTSTTVGRKRDGYPKNQREVGLSVEAKQDMCSALLNIESQDEQEEHRTQYSGT